MRIKNTQEDIHAWARSKGWWDEPRSPGDLIALMHSELSEALEEIRNGQHPQTIYYTLENNYSKPEGFGVELVDCLVRILDTLEFYQINTEQVLTEKMHYNAARAHRHGGKIL